MKYLFFGLLLMNSGNAFGQGGNNPHAMFRGVFYFGSTDGYFYALQ